MILNVDIENVSIAVRDYVKSGELNAHKIEFNFDTNYKGLIKKAIFKKDNKNYIEVIVNDECYFPQDVLFEKGLIKIGVYAYEQINNKLILRYSPSPIDFYVGEGSYNDEDEKHICVDTSDATATANDIKKDEVAYVKGDRIVGTYEATTPVYQNKSITIIENKTETIQADQGYDAIESIEITTNIPQPSGTINITQNGTHNVNDYAQANVNIQPNLQNKQLTYYSNEVSTISADQGYDGLGNVEITIDTPIPKPDWVVLWGDEHTPEQIINDFDYSTTIMENFVPSQILNNLYRNNTDLVYMPYIPITDAFTLNSMFENCTNLVYLPVLDTSNVRDMNNIFYNCTKLADDALSNILKMCTNAYNVYQKTLTSLGLSNDQITRCQTLDNWPIAYEAGWRAN